MKTLATLVLFALLSTQSWATTYYISPTGSNSNNGLTTGAPFLTFAYAINASRAWCGDSLVLRNGTYGDGTSTGLLNIQSVVCTLGDELTIRAENSRQAKIYNDGTGYAVRVRTSAYLIFDGLYQRSVDNNYSPSNLGATLGELFVIENSNHIIVRNGLSRNPNRYGNNHTFVAYRSQDVLFEDNESYVFGRHCVSGGESDRIVVRRQYCNARGGMIAGAFNPGGLTIGTAGAVFVMYPCRDCVLENSIGDGTTHSMFLTGMDALSGNGVLMTGSKVFGSILYRPSYNNGHNIVSRRVGLTDAPQNILVKDVAVVEYKSPSPAFKLQDCVNCQLDHITVLASSVNPGATGVNAFDSSLGGTAADNSTFITNMVVAGVTGTGYAISGNNVWSGDEVVSYNNGTAFSPSLPSNWTNTSTADPQFGTCKAWVPAASPLKGAGTGGSDIGATILYRYVDGVLTDTPLWDPTTGEFPHGAIDMDGTNDVTGESAKDIHTRLNINTGGCSFPSGYGTGGGTPTEPATHVASSGTGAISHAHTIGASKSILAFISLRDGGGNVGTVTAVSSSCGGDSFTEVNAGTVSHATTKLHRTVLWKRTSATSGTCTISATTSGTVGSWIMTTIEHASTLVVTGSASNGGVGTAPTATVPTNTSETIYTASTGSSSTTFSAGSNQTLQMDTLLSPFRQAVSTKSGDDGGVVNFVQGTSAHWSLVSVSLETGSPDPPPTATLTQVDYLFVYPIGTEAGATPIKYWLSDSNAKNLPITMHPDGLVRVRIMLQGGVATTSPFTGALYCRQNADSYTQVMNTEGATTFRLYGAGVDPDIPSHLATTTDRLCGSNCIPGAILRDQSAPLTIPALAVGEKIEVDAVLQLVGASGTVDCQLRGANGTAFDTYTNTPRMTITGVAAGAQ